jgi:protoheme ferro-lyase
VSLWPAATPSRAQRAHNIKIRRTASFNARPEFIAAIADIVSDAIDSRA